MKQKIKNELIVLSVVDIIRKGTAAVLLLALGATVGYLHANEKCEPCPIGFASMQDMVKVYEQLVECQKNN
tara:strand:- start:2583 stop:2795 length:213 start_codon:yes stop_codon:yes gene_type:complete